MTPKPQYHLYASDDFTTETAEKRQILLSDNLRSVLFL
jgi:hypothetical protein